MVFSGVYALVSIRVVGPWTWFSAHATRVRLDVHDVPGEQLFARERPVARLIQPVRLVRADGHVLDHGQHFQVVPDGLPTSTSGHVEWRVLGQLFKRVQYETPISNANDMGLKGSRCRCHWRPLTARQPLSPMLTYPYCISRAGEALATAAHHSHVNGIAVG